MLEKLLLAATITLALNLFLGASSSVDTPTESGLFSQQIPNLTPNLLHSDNSVQSQQIADAAVQLF